MFDQLRQLVLDEVITPSRQALGVQVAPGVDQACAFSIQLYLVLGRLCSGLLRGQTGTPIPSLMKTSREKRVLRHHWKEKVDGQRGSRVLIVEAGYKKD